MTSDAPSPSDPESRSRANPADVGAWLAWAERLHLSRRTGEALQVIDEGLAANPGDERLLQGKVLVLRWLGRADKAVELLEGLRSSHDDRAWLHFNLGDVLRTFDRRRATEHLRRAVELEPGSREHAIALLSNLEKTVGPGEGERLDEAFALARSAMAAGANRPAEQVYLASAFQRVCAFDDLAALGSFEDLGRSWAAAGYHTALLGQMGQANTAARRRELLAQHRLWAQRIEAEAAKIPIRRPAPRAVGRKIRLGFLSSDLRRHPVGHFASPLFEHADRERFDLSVYNFRRAAPDALQALVAANVDALHTWPDISPRDAAQRIADDDLDVLIELGGSTQWNKLEVMAFRPAPRQASWLGYPHSTGLSTIDWLICDPFCRPAEPDLLVETPLVLPSTWIGLSPMAFDESTPVIEPTPEARSGYVTFGTASAPNKYTRDLLRTWARIVAATPGSRFAFVRSEAASEAFRANVAREFAAEGVSPDRLVWRIVEGAHLHHYNEIDISLDTFPRTGGATTAESLWMGVPVVSLVGPAQYERITFSMLSNIGLGHFAATDVDEYARIARDLAADSDGRGELRRTLRARMRRSPLGDGVRFARAFYDLIDGAVRGAAPAA